MDNTRSYQYMDQDAINYTPSQLATSYVGSMAGNDRRDDDGHTRVSYTSYAPTEDDRQVRKERGRDFNVLSETYSLPTGDVDEWDRLDKQHRAIVLGLGGLYPAADVVRTILSPADGVKRILDLGCGTGIWSTEMAREFPHCEVVGLDLAPVPLPPDRVPPNCRFEMDDINLGLHHLQGQFDVVFARLIGLGFKDFRKSLSDMETCAKPGGIMIWFDGDYDIYSGWPPVYRPFWSSSNPNGSYAQRLVYEMRRSATLGGSDMRTMEKVIEAGFWDRDVFDPNTCKAASLYLPVGTWCERADNPAQTELLRYVGILLRQDFSEASRSIEPLLLRAGWSKETTDRWGVGMREECQNDTLGLRFRIAWGRRRAGPNLPAPALPEFTSSKENSPATKYPFYEVYDTWEQALAAAAIRNRDKDIPAPPLASQSTE